MNERAVQHQPGFEAASAASSAAMLCVLLAGHRAMRPGVSVAHELGIPVAALPIDAERSLAEAWDDALESAAITTRRLLALTHASERRYFERSRVAPSGGDAMVREAALPSVSDRLVLAVDRAEHRGAAGTVADLADAEIEAGRSCDAGALVLEASAWPGFDLRGFVGAVQAFRAECDAATPLAVVGAAPADDVAGDGADELRPAGVFYLSSAALRLVPRVGYFDLKEQLLAAILGAGGRVRSWIGARRFSRVVGRESYLEAIRLRLETGARSRAGDVVLEPGAELRGSTVACRAVAVGARALVVDSALLPGARIGAGAIVARSVVPPGAFVPDGAFVVDQVFASFVGSTGGTR